MFKPTFKKIILCQSCRIYITEAEAKRQTVNEKTKTIFKKLIGYELPPGNICTKCNVHLLTLDVFRTNIREKHQKFYEERNFEGQFVIEEVQFDDTEVSISTAQFPILTEDPGNKKIRTNSPKRKLELEESIIEKSKRKIVTKHLAESSLKALRRKFPLKTVRAISKANLLELQKEAKSKEQEPVVENEEQKPPVIVEVKEEPDEVPATVIEEPMDFDNISMTSSDLVDSDQFVVAADVVKDEYNEYEISESVEVVQTSEENSNSLDELVLKPEFCRQTEDKLNEKPTRGKFKTLGLNENADSMDESEIVVTEEIDYDTVDVVDDRIEVQNFLPNLKPIKSSMARQYVQYKCDHCTLYSRSREIVVRHIKEYHALNCNVCLKLFPSIEKLEIHKENAHNMNTKEAVGSRRKQKLEPIKEALLAFRMRSKK